MTQPPSEEFLYWRELRVERLTKKYLNAMHSFKDFEHTSMGISLMEKINKLKEPLNENS